MLTYNCQMKCPYCAIDRSNPDMPEQVLFQSIDLLLTSPLKEVELQFFGGEPLLRRDLIKKGINYAQKMSRGKRKKIRYLLTTNGLLLNEQNISYFKKYPFTVMFSMDGDKETQVRNRPLINGEYPDELLINNLKHLIKSKMDYFINLTFLPENLADLEKNVHYLMDLGAKNIQLSYTIGTHWLKQDIQSYFQILKRIIKIPDLNLRNLLSESEPVLSSTQILVDSSGKIYLGCAAVLEKTFPELNKSFYFKELAKVTDILSLEKTKEEQMTFLEKINKKFSPKLQRMIADNLRLGKMLSGFFKRKSFLKRENFVNSLMIMTTYQCQLACDYCQVQLGSPSMSEEILFRSIDFLLTTASPQAQLRFWGGEPLLKWNLIKQGMDYGERKAREKGKEIKFMITTNGLLLDKKKLDFLNKHPVQIMFSLDGDRQTNQIHRIYKGKGDIYERLLKNLKSLIRSGLTYFINMVVTPLNVEKLFSNLIFFKDLGVEKIQICHQVTDPWSERKIQKYLEELEKIRKEPALIEIIMNFTNHSEPQFLSNEIIADTDGKIYFDGSIFLEKKYPEFRDACYLGHVLSLKNIDSLLKDRDDIYLLFKQNALLQGRKIFLNNIHLGRKLAHFFDNFFYVDSSFKDDEKPFSVNFFKNEFCLQKDLVRQLKINALFFHLKGRCLNNCIFCRQMNQDWTDFFEAVEEFPVNKKLKFKKLCFIGNEPLLYPHILDTVALAKKCGFREIEILTSGELLSDRFFLEELIKRGVTSFSLPIFGSNEKVHDAIVQREGSFKELFMALMNLKQKKEINVYVHTNLLKQNLANLLALEKMISREFHFPFIIFPTRTKFSNLSFKEYTPSYPVLIDGLRGKVNSLFGFPFCVSRIVQKNFIGEISDSMKLYFIHQRFVKSGHCRKCLYLKDCIGVFKDYIKVYSDKDFLRYGKFKR